MSYVEVETGRYVKRWAFWNPATWSIPKLYWDAWSQEQRLHAICRQLEKVIKYADYLGVNVDDIAARLKAIEEGQLDPIIEAAIESWFEENEPEIVQAIETLQENLGALVERVEADETEIDTYKPLKTKLNLSMFDGSSQNNFTCKIISADGANVLIETGALVDYADVNAWIQDHGVDKFDAFIITHMHSDHVQNWKNIIDNFCDENTKIYKQMEPTLANDNYAEYADYTDAITTYLASLDYPAMIVPANGQQIQLGDNGFLKLTFYNTSVANREVYDESWGCAGTSYYPGNENAGKSTLNNYSLCVFFDCGDSTYFECGDLEGEGQRLNAQFMRPVTVALNPHHFYNKMGYEEFYDKLDPEIWLVSNHFVPTQSEPVGTFNFSLSYLSRYIRYNGNDVNILTNTDGNVEIEMLNGKVKSYSGYLVDQDYNPDNVQIEPHFAAILPPDVYSENPYFSIGSDFTLEYLFSEMRRRYNPALVPISAYIPATGSGAYGAECAFAQAVRALWSPLDISANTISMHLDQCYRWHFTIPMVQSPCSELILFSATGNVPGNISFANELKGPLTKEVEGPFSNLDVIPENTANLNYILRSSIIGAVLSTGAIIPMFRQAKYSTTFSSNFAGMLNSTDGSYIYAAQLLTNRTVYIRRIKVSDGTVDVGTIKINSFHIIA